VLWHPCGFFTGSCICWRRLPQSESGRNDDVSVVLDHDDPPSLTPKTYRPFFDTGEPDDAKVSRPVRRGADGKVLRPRGVTRRRPTLHASTLFHLLYRFSPEIRTAFGRSEESRWIERYGFVERIVGRPDDDALEDGRSSRRRRYRTLVRERPGLASAALFHLIGHSVFLRLTDVAAGLPPYGEQVQVSSLNSTDDATGFSQRSAYTHVCSRRSRTPSTKH